MILQSEIVSLNPFTTFLPGYDTVFIISTALGKSQENSKQSLAGTRQVPIGGVDT